MSIHSASTLAAGSVRSDEAAAASVRAGDAELSGRSDGIVNEEGSSLREERECGVESTRLFSGALKSYFRLVLLDALSSLEGRKLLFLDESLSCGLSALVEASALQQRGVERCFPLQDIELEASSLSAETALAPSVLFLCRGRLSLLSPIVRHIQHIEATFPEAVTAASQSAEAATVGDCGEADEAFIWSLPKPSRVSHSRRQFFVVLIPTPSDFFASELRRRLSATSQSPSSNMKVMAGGASALPAAAASLLSTIGTSILPLSSAGSAIATPEKPDDGAVSAECVAVLHCPLYFFPLADDVVSLELQNFFRAVHGRGDMAPCREAADALFFLQQIQEEGVVANLRCIGSSAKAVADGLVRRRREIPREVEALRFGGEDLLASSKCKIVESAFAVPPVTEALSEFDVEEEECCGFGEDARQDGRKGACFSGFSQVQPGTGRWSTRRLKPRSVISEAGADSLEMLVLFDRRVDLITPLCTPFTYEGLLDAVFGLNGDSVCLPSKLLVASAVEKDAASVAGFGSSASPTEVPLAECRRVSLANDSLFSELRDLPQTQVGAALHRVASEIQRTYEEKETLRTIADISSFMPRFKVKQQEHSSLSIHVKLASFLSAVARSETFHRRLCFEDALLQNAPSASGGVTGASFDAFVINEMHDFIDESAQTEAEAALGTRCCAMASVYDIYRLLSLSSLVNGGLKHKTLMALQSLVVQQHGIQEVRRLAMMQRVGLLRDSQSSASAKLGTGSSSALQGPQRWNFIRERLRLLVDESSASEDDISFVCSGYAPLSVRLLQKLHSEPKGWRSMPDVLNLLWGPAIEVRQQKPACQSATSVSSQADEQKGSREEDRKKLPPRRARVELVGVVFLGGVCHAELAAIRKLNAIERKRYSAAALAGKTAEEKGRRPIRQFIVFTTEILGARSLIDSLRDESD